jgi:hypothetical protein
MRGNPGATDQRRQAPTTDLVAVLDGLAHDLEDLMDGEVRFLKVLPPGPVPVGLPEEEIEQIVLGLVARMRRCIEDGGWMLAAVERVTLNDTEAAPLGLAAGEYAMLRVAARFEASARTSPLVRLAAAAVDSMGGGLGGRALRALAARQAGAVQIGAVPGAGITATVFLSAPAGSAHRFLEANARA